MPTTYAELLKSRPARGAWIEMLVWAKGGTYQPRSRPARGAWIEIILKPSVSAVSECRAPQGARGLKLKRFNGTYSVFTSRPARGAWIEIRTVCTPSGSLERRAPQGARGLKSLAWAPASRGASSRAPQGARGLKLPLSYRGLRLEKSRPARGAWIEILPSLCLGDE